MTAGPYTTGMILEIVTPRSPFWPPSWASREVGDRLLVLGYAGGGYCRLSFWGQEMVILEYWLHHYTKILYDYPQDYEKA